jgi:hypothetical protein
MRITRTLLIGLVGLLGTALAAAQDVTAEQQKLMAKRAAEADAYRKLAEAVYGLQINSRTHVQDFVTESDDIRGDVDTFIKGIRLGQPIYYEDGSCEVPAEVTVAKVVETLRSAHSRHYHGDDIKTDDFESMTRKIEKKVIKVTGMGAPRPDLPPELPEGVAEVLGPPPTAGPPPIPDIWRQIGPQATLSARRAAQLDAYRRLAERIKGLRLTSRTIVRDFVAESDMITTELDAFLQGAQEKGGPAAYYLHSNELIAECTLVIPTEQVIETIKTLHARHYKGDDVRGSDIEKVVRTVVKRDFEATGMGIPNPRFIRRAAATSAAAEAMPDWSMQGLEVEGQGTDPEMNTSQGKLRAARAAELDARRKLAEQIGGLRIKSETTVRDFIAQHDDIAVLMDAVIVDAVVTKTRFTDTTATVTVAVPGARVWSVLADELRRPAR